MRELNLNDNGEYRFRYREDPDHCDGPFEECARCGYPAPLHEFRHGPLKLLCCLCANTPDLYGNTAISATICHVGNTILMAMGAFGPKPLPPTSS